MNGSEKHQHRQVYCLSDQEDCLEVQQRVHELEMSEARYRNLFEAVKDALVSFDRAGRARRANSACGEVLGYAPQWLVGRSVKELFANSKRVSQVFAKVLQGKAQIFEQNHSHPGGRQLTLELHFTPILDREEVYGVLLLARDLTAEKRRDLERSQLFADLEASHLALEEKARDLEESRRQQQEAMAEQDRVNSELRELGRLKSDFIGIASHELRTPLTFLLGSLEYLGESLPEKINADEKGLFDYAMQGARRLSDIVENMLDIVRLEAGGFRPQTQEVSIQQLLEHIAVELSWTLRDGKQVLQISQQTEWPQLPIDPLMVRRALEDVIENAIKFADAGGRIEVRGRYRDRQDLLDQAELIGLFWPEFPEQLGDHQRFFEIEVRDNGIGIPGQELPHVFERFFTGGRIEEHSSNQARLGGGAGLGLALVKRIMRSHGGLVWANSPGSVEETGLDNPGSSFHLLFPYSEVKQVRESAEEGRKRVLVVDDEPAIRRFLEILLGAEYQLELAENGAAGLRRAREFRPDLILLDLYMPGMDGFEVCRQLKEDQQTRDIPVSIFTAVARQQERDRVLGLGAIDYITKPFFPRELLERVEKLLADHPRSLNR